MKIKFFLTAVACLFLLSMVGHAQVPPNFAQMRQSPFMQQVMKNGVKTGIRSFWNGQGANLMAFGMLNDSDIRAAWGVSDEQHQQIQGLPMRMGMEMQNNAELMEVVREMQALGGHSVLFDPNADAATQQKFQGVQEKLTALSVGFICDGIDNIMTPEQKQKMNESLLANLSEMPVASPSMFEILDLNDAQKQQMNAIKKELEPEFEKNLENFSSASMVLANMMYDEMEKQGFDLVDMQKEPEKMQEKIREMTEKMQPIQKKLMENPEYKKISDEINSTGKIFSAKLNTKMFDILTDEQWNRLQHLIDNPPEYAKIFGKKMKEQQAQKEQAGGWQPGPNSWKPGDPIPEGYRQQRSEGRFPRNVPSE